MRLIYLLVYLIILVITVAFAISNYQLIDINLFPLSYTVTLPLFIIIFLCVFIGYFIGRFSSVFIKNYYVRKQRKQDKKIKALENEISGMKMNNNKIQG